MYILYVLYFSNALHNRVFAHIIEGYTMRHLLCIIQDARNIVADFVVPFYLYYRQTVQCISFRTRHE